jgi:alpha-galactosidase
MKHEPTQTIEFREGDIPGARYISGPVVFDEFFRDGRLCTRYWNPNGQVWPDMHYGDIRWAAGQKADTFRVAINGQPLMGGFTWESATIEPDTSRWRAPQDSQGRPAKIVHGVIHLLHVATGIRVHVHTRIDGSPFLVRWLEIHNPGSQPIAISEVAPFAGMLWNHRTEEHLPPDRPSPFELFYNHSFEWGHEGDFFAEPLMPGIKTVDGGKKGRSGWGRPAFWARNICNGQTFVCELAWGGNYEFELEHQTLGQYDGHWLRPLSTTASLFFKMGLSGYDQALRVLDAGETIETPAVHLALFQSNTDAIIQATHDHVRHVVMPAQLPERHIEIEANHRGYLCDRENVPDILKDIQVAKSVGAEMYVIDAGWFGNEPNQWGANVGDWFDGPWMTKGGGLKAVSDFAHQQGMTFGLWVEIEAAGAASALRKEHPEWLYRRNDQPVADGRALDITQPAVVAFMETQITRLISELSLDMYRIDHNHCLSPAGNRAYQGFTEDLTWRYYDNLYAMFDRLRTRFPKVVFQNCAGGGGRLDWGTLSRFHNAELSDWMRLPRGLRILYGVTASLPPEILLRTFGTEVHEHVLDGDVDAQLRLCLSRIIFRGIAPSTEALTEHMQERVTHFVDLYKQAIRPLMVEGRVYHHTPFRPHTEHISWCVTEIAQPDGRAAVATVFRTSLAQSGPVSSAVSEDEYIFRPRGLDPALEYEVTLDNLSKDFAHSTPYQASGNELMYHGIRIRLDQPLTSELILFRAV